MVDSSFIVGENEGGIRLDKWLSRKLPDYSRSRLQQLVAEGQLTLNGVTLTDVAYKVKRGDALALHVPEVKPLDLSPVPMPINVVFEDAQLIVINKPAGLTVHPSPTSKDATLVHGLLAHCRGQLSGIGGVARPGIVHRIDKDTSGLLVVAKTDLAHQRLSAQIKRHLVRREYRAICWGVPNPLQGTITGNIGRSPKNRKKMAVVSGGKPATTHYQVAQIFRNGSGKDTALGFAAEICCQLETGRTHQIRVHFTHIGHPLLGDPLYGSNSVSRINKISSEEPARLALLNFNRQALHAEKLVLYHPVTEAELTFTAPLPDDMKHLIDHLHSI